MKAAIVATALLAVAAASAAQDGLSAAKDLYASAAYEDALSALARVDAGNTAPEVAQQADQYRVFCLFALGRTNEAETVAESLLRKNPLVELDSGAASPRIEAMFSDVRKRVLPTLIRSEYRTARTAIEEKRLAIAEPHLVQASRMLAVARKSGPLDDSLADLSVLVDGFLELTRTAEKTAAAPAAAPASQQTGATQTPAVARNDATQPAPVKSIRVYNAGDEDIVAPVAINQDIPGANPAFMAVLAGKRGLIDVFIDENGNVQEATIRQPLHPSYDQQLILAAHRWKYKPAMMRDGTPVRYVKTLVVTVKR